MRCLCCSSGISGTRKRSSVRRICFALRFPLAARPRPERRPRGVRLFATRLEGADFSDANLLAALFEEAHLNGANFTAAECGYTAFLDVDLSAVQGLDTICLVPIAHRTGQNEILLIGSPTARIRDDVVDLEEGSDDPL